jgi:hypothetical protein
MFSFCKQNFFQKFFCKEGTHCTSCYVAVGFIGSEGSTHGQTNIYYITPSRWIAEGITICAVSNFINTGKIFGGG